MLDHIREFARLLRDNGVRVSTAEILDAAIAVDTVDIRRPDMVRAALAGNCSAPGGVA